MKEKYSLFKLEKFIDDNLSRNCFEHLGTFDTLEEAYDNSVHILEKTIILPSY